MVILEGMNKIYRKLLMTTLVIMMMGVLAGCGKSESDDASADSNQSEVATEQSLDATENESANAESEEAAKSITGLEESAKDAYVDFDALGKINPDIFAWMYIPGTNVDLPILFNNEDDTYYENHDVFGKGSSSGAPYLDMHNYPDMCDFNTVIHGSGGKDGLFEALSAYEDAVYFEENPDMVIYLDGNVLNYTIVAAYRAEKINLFKEYNFQSGSGCQAYVNELYHNKFIGKSTRAEFEGLGENNFLVTILVDDPDRADTQLVVVAALVSDAAGTIDRPPFDEENVFEGFDMENLDIESMIQDIDFQITE